MYWLPITQNIAAFLILERMDSHLEVDVNYRRSDLAFSLFNLKIPKVFVILKFSSSTLKLPLSSSAAASNISSAVIQPVKRIVTDASSWNGETTAKGMKMRKEDQPKSQDAAKHADLPKWGAATLYWLINQTQSVVEKEQKAASLTNVSIQADGTSR